MAAPAGVPSALAARLDAELKEYRGIQKEVQKVMQSRQQYTTQLNENEMVKKVRGDFLLSSINSIERIFLEKRRWIVASIVLDKWRDHNRCTSSKT